MKSRCPEIPRSISPPPPSGHNQLILYHATSVPLCLQATRQALLGCLVVALLCGAIHKYRLSVMGSGPYNGARDGLWPV